MKVLGWLRWRQWRLRTVISTNVGGLPEINIDGKINLGNVGDIETMSKQAIQLLSDEKQRFLKKTRSGKRRNLIS